MQQDQEFFNFVGQCFNNDNKIHIINLLSALKVVHYRQSNKFHAHNF